MRELTVISLVIMTLLSSCGDKQLETTYDRQESDIESIITNLTGSTGNAMVERNGGSVRVTVVEGEGAPLDEKGAVAFYYAGYYISGGSLSSSTVFATNYETFAQSIRWSLSDTTAFDIMTVRLGEDEIVEGLRNGIIGVKGGEECYVMFNGRHGFGKRKISNIPPNAALAFHLWIKSVSND